MILSMSSSVKSVVPRTMASLLRKKNAQAGRSVSTLVSNRNGSALCSWLKLRSLEFERLPQLGCIARVDFKDAAERVRMAAVGEFCRDRGAKLRVSFTVITRRRGFNQHLAGPNSIRRN